MSARFMRFLEQHGDIKFVVMRGANAQKTIAPPAATTVGIMRSLSNSKAWAVRVSASTVFAFMVHHSALVCKMNAAHAILQAVQADLLENVLIALHRRCLDFLMDSYHDVTRNLQLAVKLIGAAGSHFDILFKCLAIEKANNEVSTYFDDQVGRPCWR